MGISFKILIFVIKTPCRYAPFGHVSYAEPHEASFAAREEEPWQQLKVVVVVRSPPVGGQPEGQGVLKN